MALRHDALSNFFSHKRIPCDVSWAGYKLTDEVELTPTFKPNNQDTYVCVFGPAQGGKLAGFEAALKAANGYVVYRSPMAHNTNYPRSGPRNTLVVFEFE